MDKAKGRCSCKHERKMFGISVMMYPTFSELLGSVPTQKWCKDDPISFLASLWIRARRQEVCNDQEDNIQLQVTSLQMQPKKKKIFKSKILAQVKAFKSTLILWGIYDNSMSLVLKIAIFDGVVQYNARLGTTGNNQI